MTEHRADTGTAVVMDPNTGEILAMASYPTFNPNTFRDASEASRKNRAVTDLYEPGSTFKLVTASAALEEGVVTPTDLIDTDPGYIRFPGRQIDDTHHYGVLTFADAIVKSSNVGAIRVGLRLGATRLGAYVEQFGFGRPSSPDFPGESSGIVWDPTKLNDSALASVSMGYQVGVTPLQMAAAASVVANGGRLVQPRVLRAVVRDGERTPVTPTDGTHVISARTAAELTSIMEDVVVRGTGTSARVEGFTVAGKTGTAQKLVAGHYSHTDYNVSFVGFVPSRKPTFTVVVVVDTPRAGQYFGGSVSAPIFQRIADASLRYLGRRAHGLPAAASVGRPWTAGAARWASHGAGHQCRIVGRPHHARRARPRRSRGPSHAGRPRRHADAPRLRCRDGAVARTRPCDRWEHTVHPRARARRRQARVARVRTHAVNGQDLIAALGDLVVPSGTALAPTASARVTGVAYDSRQVQPGAVFVALRGLKADGVDFVPQAIAAGAALVVSESEPPAGLTTPWVVVRDARLALALLGAAVHAHPSRDIPVVGVTGTNGKTTTAYLLAAIFDAAGLSAGVLGTVHYKVGSDERDASRTTPEAPDVQALLREMVQQGNRACVMEVSSHALALKRVDGMRFAAAVFTNLTRDHLDFHEDMESYFAAKRRLFEMLPPESPGVINADDPRASSLASACRTPYTFGIQKPADVRPEALSMDLSGVRFVAVTATDRVSIRSTLVGRPNVYNLLAAAATAVAIGLPTEAISTGLSRLKGVPGRFEVVSTPSDGVTVVVDYAHTDDALRNLLETARPLARGRVITVFGCGGDRDRPKRPLMGMVAARLSDVVVITSDNPRSEDPAAIVNEIKRGIPAGEAAAGRTPDVRTIVDRADAIERAIALAQPGDMVLIAGKGHEKTQHIGARVLPFDDAEVARAVLARRRPSRVG